MISIKRHIVLMKGAVAGLALGATSLDVVLAADATLPLKAPRVAPVFDWSGLYVGGHVGYGGGSFGPGTNPLPQQGIFFPHTITGLIGGYQAGYNLQLPNKWVVGVEADISFTSPLDRPKLVPAPFHTTFDYFGTARGRIGYGFGTWLPYVTGGAAWGRTRVDLNDPAGDVIGNKIIIGSDFAQYIDEVVSINMGFGIRSTANIAEAQVSASL